MVDRMQGQNERGNASSKNELVKIVDIGKKERSKVLARKRGLLPYRTLLSMK